MQIQIPEAETRLRTGKYTPIKSPIVQETVIREVHQLRQYFLSNFQLYIVSYLYEICKFILLIRDT
jgi:hypothetical protein